MKRIMGLILTAAMLLGCLAGCGGTASGSDGLSIVTTIFPQYDWVRQILGRNAENVKLTMLMDSGVDMHNYQPTAEDLVLLASCDMFIYVGGESDEWVEGALTQADNADMIAISLMEVLGDNVKVAQGIEHEHHEGEEHDHAAHGDEHVWLSLKNAQLFCDYIAAKLGQLDAENAQVYLDNAAAYNTRLKDLDAQYQAAVDSAAFDTLLFGDRFPFVYLTEDYGLSYYAAFSGCSAESEASFETIAFLSGRVDAMGLKSVIMIEGTTHDIAQTVVNNTKTKDQQILTLNSLQSVTAAGVENGVTYLGVMGDNLEVLKTALN